MDYDSKQTDPLLGTTNSRPPAFNTDYATPPSYSQPQPSYAPPPAPPPAYGGINTANNTNVVVVTQPTSRPVQMVPRRYASDYLALSICMLVCCLLTGPWYPLVCIIPALVVSIMARDDNDCGRPEEAGSKGKIALALNIVGLVTGLLTYLGCIVLVAVVVVREVNSAEQTYTVTPYYPTSTWPGNN